MEDSTIQVRFADGGEVWFTPDSMKVLKDQDVEDGIVQATKEEIEAAEAKLKETTDEKEKGKAKVLVKVEANTNGASAKAAKREKNASSTADNFYAESTDKAATDGSMKALGLASASTPKVGAGPTKSPAAAPVDIPEGWEIAKSRSTGRTYYINSITGDTQFKVPTMPAAQVPPKRRTPRKA